MTQTYLQLQKQIANLQTEAERLKRAEVAEVIAKIRGAIDVYGITAQDLFGNRTGAVRSVRPAAKSKSKLSAVAKFADAQGNTWVGRGPRPQWLRDAMGAGKTLAEFAVGRTRAKGKAPGTASASAGKVKPSKAPAKKKVAAKYSDGNGNSWSGRGSRPRWLTSAIEGGKSIENFRL